MSRFVPRLCQVSLVVAALCTAERANAQSQTGRPIPPRLALHVTHVACSYGGAVPAITVAYDLTSPIALTHLRADSLMLLIHGGWSNGVDGAIETRMRAGTTVSPFNGTVAGGTATSLDTWGRLALRPFGSGVNYADVRAVFRIVFSADQGVFVLDGPACTITPGG